MAAVLDDILSPAQATAETKVSTCRQIASRPRTRRQGSNTPTTASTPTPRSRALAQVPVSLHCWQGDDVGGFENFGESLGGGIAATGNYPGRARTPDELRSDAAKALSLIPGTHRFNLHAFYGEFGGKRVDRDEIGPEHFAGWIDWAKSLGIGLDFNPTFFSHPKAADNFTLAHHDAGVRAVLDPPRRSRAVASAPRWARRWARPA